MVKFDRTPAENALILQIVDRADRLGLLRNERAKFHTQMDLAATHANGCPLDFEKLLGFDDFDFKHDMFGIARHLDRSTGELMHCFYPRCAR